MYEPDFMDPDHKTRMGKTTSFQNYVGAHSPNLPFLPLTHAMDRRRWGDQTQMDSILPDAERCDVYDEYLTYLFYGRPAFRPHGENRPSSKFGLLPVCFILREDAVRAIKRLYPFDTGAHAIGLYDYALSKDCDREVYSLPTSISSAAQCVSAFYESSEKYLLAYPKVGMPSGVDPDCEKYIRLITETDELAVDDRVSAIELQVEVPIELKDKVLAVIGPRDIEYALKNDAATIPWYDDNVEIVTYTAVGRSSPREAFGAMRERALAWLLDRYGENV